MENSTVLIVSLLTWLGVFAYLWYIDRKLKGPKGQ
jgi:CcmD family protein